MTKTRVPAVDGLFTEVDGVERNHIARLNDDGSLDLSFDPGYGANDIVRALAVDAAASLSEQGKGVRVVSMPSAERFCSQDASYREQVLPSHVLARVAVEAAHADYWHKFVGLDGRIVGMTSFGESAPGDLLKQEFGFTVDNVVSAVQDVLLD